MRVPAIQYVICLTLVLLYSRTTYASTTTTRPDPAETTTDSATSLQNSINNQNEQISGMKKEIVDLNTSNSQKIADFRNDIQNTLDERERKFEDQLEVVQALNEKSIKDLENRTSQLLVNVYQKVNQKLDELKKNEVVLVSEIKKIWASMNNQGIEQPKEKSPSGYVVPTQQTTRPQPPFTFPTRNIPTGPQRSSQRPPIRPNGRRQ